MELKRWQTGVDFQIVQKCGYVQSNSNSCQDVVELSSEGLSQCEDECSNIQMILNFQRWEANGEVVLDGESIQSDVFASRLVANLQRQITCNNQPDNHDDSNCPTEPHYLDFSGSSVGVCGLDFWFHANQDDNEQPLVYPGQLKNQLITFGSPQNPYLDFSWLGGDVRIDPSPDTVSGSSSSAGCPVLSSSGKYSRRNLTGECCSYLSRSGVFERSSFHRYYWLCR